MPEWLAVANADSIIIWQRVKARCTLIYCKCLIAYSHDFIAEATNDRIDGDHDAVYELYKNSVVVKTLGIVVGGLAFFLYLIIFG